VRELCVDEAWIVLPLLYAAGRSSLVCKKKPESIIQPRLQGTPENPTEEGQQ